MTPRLAWGPGLTSLQHTLAVVTDESLAAAFELPDQVADGDHDRLIAAFSAVGDGDPRWAASTYAALAEAGVDAPPRLRCWRHGEATTAPTADIELCPTPRWRGLLDGANVPYLIASRAESQLLERWGCHPSERVHEDVDLIGSREALALSDLYPALHERGRSADIRVVRCEEIRVTVATSEEQQVAHPEILATGVDVIATAEADEQELIATAARLAGVHLQESEIVALLEHRVSEEQARRRTEIREAGTLAERLVLAIGEPALRASIPAPLTARIGGQDAELLGELALAVHGVDVLRLHRNELDRSGLAPPRTWAGSTQAVEFVTDLGFPESFAGFPADRPPDRMVVLGRPGLQPLHDFQVPLHAAVRDTLRSDPPERGLLSLPTGSGKTRIAMQAIVDHVREADHPQRILWVAQTEELCEQAVQTLRYVWRAYGPDEELTISRLWGSGRATATSGHHVVVAGIAKLAAIIGGPRDYSWLREIHAIIVDEAHRSVPKSYTELMRWLGLRVGQRREGQVDPAPMLGLTATPFRGVNEAETAQLVARYNGNRLDTRVFGDIDAVHQRLQSDGFLSSVEHQVLGGSSFQLSDAQLAHLERFGELPKAVEEALGVDEERNRQIIEALLALPDDWPALVFAASVEHAKILAALLRLQEVPAAPIWGETPRPARRHYIEQFRAGELRVLTNYNVLAEGFDAPAVRAVVIGRPTFSPNRYQQMIGRGLRGPRNGGEELCRIIDVQDNVERFGRSLAFRQFEPLWGREVTDPPPFVEPEPPVPPARTQTARTAGQVPPAPPGIHGQQQGAPVPPEHPRLPDQHGRSSRQVRKRAASAPPRRWTRRYDGHWVRPGAGEDGDDPDGDR